MARKPESVAIIVRKTNFLFLPVRLCRLIHVVFLTAYKKNYDHQSYLMRWAFHIMCSYLCQYWFWNTELEVVSEIWAPVIGYDIYFLLVNNQLDALFSMYLFISLLYMFLATQCSSSVGSNCIGTSSSICHLHTVIYIQVFPGGMCQTSGGCSLC